MKLPSVTGAYDVPEQACVLCIFYKFPDCYGISFIDFVILFIDFFRNKRRRKRRKIPCVLAPLKGALCILWPRVIRTARNHMLLPVCIGTYAIILFELCRKEVLVIKAN